MASLVPALSVHSGREGEGSPGTRTAGGTQATELRALRRRHTEFDCTDPTLHTCLSLPNCYHLILCKQCHRALGDRWQPLCLDLYI